MQNNNCFIEGIHSEDNIAPKCANCLFVEVGEKEKTYYFYI